MVQILREYVKDGFQFIEYTMDGTTVSHIMAFPYVIEEEPTD